MVENGKFRKDLFYRLNVVNIRIPPLRERMSDIPVLAASVLARTSQERGFPYSLSDDALRTLTDYDWPGNVRELEHTLERACALSSGPVLHLIDLPSPLRDFHFQGRSEASLQTNSQTNSQANLQTVSLSAASDTSFRVVPMVELEKQAILNTLRQLNGDKILAARMLGIGKTTLYRKLKEYGLHEELLA